MFCFRKGRARSHSRCMRMTANLQITCQGYKEFEEKCRIDAFQNLSQSPDQERPKFGLHRNFRELERCANDGCASCRRFRQALLLEYYSKETTSALRGSDSQVFNPMPRHESDFRDRGYRYEASLYVEVEIPDRSKFSNKLTLTDGYYGARQSNLSPQPDSQAVFAIARNWFFYCKENHFCCTTLMRLDDSSRFNPTRLLELRTCDTSEPRLIEPLERPNLPYCALSYCWAQNLNLRYRASL